MMCAAQKAPKDMKDLLKPCTELLKGPNQNDMAAFLKMFGKGV